LQKHLSLLREEYVKLQNKHSELERKYNLVSSIASQHNLNPHLDPNDNYITRLLKTISELFDKDLYRYVRRKQENKKRQILIIFGLNLTFFSIVKKKVI
jgi:hypothetical protein